ncbi:MAG: outer membrane protein assembly factor BamD [Deltaproteobacteria bacterium]|jgi:outer membrane protein assembly factor BamD|nr:outer membrane protein assembly factor BamD [Deltaproteobacteria bacterium]
MNSSKETSEIDNRKGALLPVLLLLAAVSFGSYGCGGTNLMQFYFGDLFGKGGSPTEKNADLLALEGMQKMREKKYGDAVKAFQRLKDQYPYSKYAVLAELKLGDAHFYKKNYSEAAIAYEEFARLHPRNEVVPYVLYQIGMCHFLSFSTIDRDQEETQQAIEAFRRVVATYPNSEYAKKARKQLVECQKRAVAREFYVGQFYYRSGEYAAAKGRLEKINEKYPEAVEALGYEKRLDKMLTKSEKKAAKGPKKPSIWARMGF